MIQTTLAINGHDCTIADGNTAEEYDAIAVALLTRSGRGRARMLGHDGKMLAWVHVHVCGPTCNEHTLDQPPTIERFECVGEPRQSRRAVALTMIDQYRRI